MLEDLCQFVIHLEGNYVYQLCVHCVGSGNGFGRHFIADAKVLLLTMVLPGGGGQKAKAYDCPHGYCKYFHLYH